jgi:serine protease Do
MRLRVKVLAVVLGVGAAGVALGADAPGSGAGAVTRPAGMATSQPGVPPISLQANSAITNLPPAPLVPKTVDDLKAIQARVEAVAKAALPATVGIILNDAQGSGVIVSKDGYVLTAGHVSGKPGQRIMIRLSTGRRVRAVTLGANNSIDSGMAKITDPGEYPFVPVGTAKNLVAGQWVVSLGHPGGYRADRPPVVRLGRVLIARDNLVATDGPLFSGDSGGPMFDLDGRLVGIHSRIGSTTSANIHVPIDTFVATWGRLAASEEWGSRTFLARGGPNDAPPRAAALGVRAVADARGAVVSQVYPGAGADAAGLLEGDVITKINDRPVKSPDDIKEMLDKQKVGDAVRVEVVRASKVLAVQVRLTAGRAGGG